MVTLLMDNSIQITDHAYDRMKERLGWSRKAGERMAQKAYLEGQTHGETRGSLHRFLDGVFLSHGNANNLRIYGEALFVFCGNKLITVYALPTRYRKLQKRR